MNQGGQLGLSVGIIVALLIVIAVMGNDIRRHDLRLDRIESRLERSQP